MRQSLLALVAAVCLGLAGWTLLGPEPARTRGAPEPRQLAVAIPEDPVQRPVAARTCAAGVQLAEEGLAARVVRATSARTRPGGRVIARFGLRNVNGVRTVFGVRASRVGRDCASRWLRVQLPIRPNGIEGWVRARDVRLFEVPTRVTVDLSERRVVVTHGTRRVLDVAAAIGNTATPTPLGRFYVNQRLRASDPTGPWGPGGVGISAFSPVLLDWAQGGPIAIHGTNQPRLIGGAVSHGCVRVSNYALLQLMRLAPEGTPVVIRA